MGGWFDKNLYTHSRNLFQLPEKDQFIAGLVIPKMNL